MRTQKLTLSQALVRYLAALRIELDDGQVVPYVRGVFAIFGHGNVSGLGDALWASRHELPTWRAHNEQGMANAAAAYAKASFRQQIMAVTTSIGPGATNLVTSAALAHVNRLPMLLLPGDVFASRRPDPVLQQLESFGQGDVSVNDCLRPVTRYFDRIQRPEQILSALPHAIHIMTDPAACGPVCLALPQDVQSEAFDCPEAFLHPELLRLRRPAPDPEALQHAIERLRQAQRPLIIAGGGVLYSQAWTALADLAHAHGIPVAETQAGKGSLTWDDPMNLGAIGVTGSPAANGLAADADLIIAVGTRLQDFTTGSNSLFGHVPLLSLNVQSLDAAKRRASTVVADARHTLQALASPLAGWQADASWTQRARDAARQWNARVDSLTASAPQTDTRPYDADVIGAVQASAADSAERDIVVCAAGTLPAELHKLWRTRTPGGYHMEYGYSTMGYEIAGGLGVKIAHPEREVIVMVGDGAYLMLNSEIASSIQLGRKLIIVVLDNQGYGCIHRLQRASGGPRFNNLLEDCVMDDGTPAVIDLAAHAASLGAQACRVDDAGALKRAMVAARAATTTQVIVIDTTPEKTTDDGGCWWEVAIPEVSDRPEVAAAHERYLQDKQKQHY
ncbi:3D-(3,5/4)-trihydroxycyclohexane-1,2-dione acylhydrolase (decyclizing) [Castellaniella sp.]|uniref:3D-(3,5/4)-trihydroxycyclohexane-1,2-dione acylhydrolase (decyclizing) n=1 Tax=Castellaniella sp. TaxID=1955812 RepID=UPI002AFE5D4F|nr:3D-(3,5/4)-trihydroxycyclohexane-1,2-dione acylhydrolase (decyclizing) [Castellaniella sp.]